MLHSRCTSRSEYDVRSHSLAKGLPPVIGERVVPGGSQARPLAWRRPTHRPFKRRVKAEDEPVEPHAAKVSPPPYAPYADEAPNAIYNLLFCDLEDAFRPSRDREPAPWQRTLFRDPPDPAAWLALASDEAGDSRVRALACARLRAAGHAVPAAPPAGRGRGSGARPGTGHARRLSRRRRPLPSPIRPHEHRRGTRHAAATTPSMRCSPRARRSCSASNRREVPRRPPPARGSLRLTFIASDGTYWGEGPLAAMSADPMAAPVVDRATRLLQAVVELSARPSHGAGGSATARDR